MPEHFGEILFHDSLEHEKFEITECKIKAISEMIKTE